MKYFKEYRELWNKLLLVMLFVVFFCFSISVVIAQSYRPFVKHFTQRDGLSHDVCRSVLKDSDGYIWITTENGLNRYDGHHFIVFKNIPDDSTSIYGNDVFELCEDNNRNIWISGANFLSRYNLDEHRFYNYAASSIDLNGYRGFFTRKIYLDLNNRLWLCSITNGLVLYRPQTDDFEYILPEPDALNSNNNSIADIVQFSVDKYWIGSNGGLLKFDFGTRSFTACIAQPNIPENFSYYNQCMSLHIDSTQEHMVWYGTWGSGLHSYNDLTGQTDVYEHTNNLPLNVSNIVFDIAKCDTNSFWICAEKGLMNFNKQTRAFQLIAHEIDNPNSIWGGEYHNIYTDSEGLIWMASNKGIELLDPLQQSFKPITLSQKPGLYNLQWNSKTQSLVGTSLYVNRSLWTIEPSSGDLRKFSIPGADKKMLEPIGIQVLSDGRILIGLTRKNPIVFNSSNNQFEEIKLSSLLGIDESKLDIRSAHEDEAGNVWMANYKGGIVLWNTKLGTAIMFGGSDDAAKPAGFKGAPHSILQHRHFIYGFIPAAGFVRVNMHNLECSYIMFNQALLAEATNVVCDTNGHFWFATPSRGLVECTLADEFQILHVYDKELPDNALEAIYLDKNNLLWINAASGLMSFNIDTKTAVIYGEADGLYPYSTDFTLTNIDRNRYYYLNEAGLGTFLLDELEQPSKYYKTILSQFFAADIPIKSEAELSDLSLIELQPNQNNISFSFSALCFSGMEKLEFAYMLEGFDDDWHYIGNNHNGSYTNLPPGNYTLMLNSKYSQIPWDSNVTAIEIIVKPHYYQTVWFKAIIALLLLAILVMVIRNYFQNKLKKAQIELEKQKSIQNIRTRISRDIHDEIGAGLTKISLMSKQMEKSVTDNALAKDQINKINTTSRQLVQNLGEIVWTINPNNDSLSDLLAYLRGYMNDLAETTANKISWNLPEISPALNSVVLHPETKRNLLLIIKESINNALKHSGASAIELNISFKRGTLSVSVTDNGKGFLMSENERKGNGLRNMIKRAEDIGSALQIDTLAGGGTNVHLILKI